MEVPVCPTWHVTGTHPLRWKRWGQQAVVYHADSGATHLLNPLAETVLRFVEQAPRDRDQIAAAVERDDDSIGLDAIDQLLREFQERGLIETA